MPRNYHEHKVAYESFEGKKEIYVTTASFKENHLKIHHYPNHNETEYLHEDRVADTYPTEMKIPLERVYHVESI